MSYTTPTLDGIPVFGLVTNVVAPTMPSAHQEEAFGGTNGVLNKFGGTRGFTVTITGVLNDSSLDALNADEQILLSYDDGVARQLVDTRNRVFNNCVFRGEYSPDPMGPKPMAGGEGWCLKYTMTFRGLG
jgi:hypothetical protein